MRYLECGVGNSTLVSTEFEVGDAEFRLPGAHVGGLLRSVYLRASVRRAVLILDTRDGVKFQVKRSPRVRLLVGLVLED